MVKAVIKKSLGPDKNFLREMIFLNSGLVFLADQPGIFNFHTAEIFLFKL